MANLIVTIIVNLSINHCRNERESVPKYRTNNCKSRPKIIVGERMLKQHGTGGIYTQPAVFLQGLVWKRLGHDKHSI